MRLEGTLDAFSLPDIFQLLSFTKKTGTLHLRREGGHGAVHLREGSVTGGRADVTCQELGRRLLGAGLVDDETLAIAAEQLADDSSLSLAQLLATSAELEASAAKAVAQEQVTDAVFSLLRWPDGEFAFVVGEADPDDLGAELPVDEVVAEGQRRLAAWGELIESVPAPSTILIVNPAPDTDPQASREEWALLALVDGRRSVAELVALSGRGEYAIVSALAGLVSRGLLVVRAEAGDQLARRQALLAALEGRTEPAPSSSAPTATPDSDGTGDQKVPEVAGADAAVEVVIPEQGGQLSAVETVTAVVPERPEPFVPSRRPDHPEATPAGARAGAGDHGSVQGATALQPGVHPAPARVERDPAIDRSLLLRLIAGVRGL